ncbi:MAG: hypothetical protein WCE68_08985 [Anaerolineales bacterium]
MTKVTALFKKITLAVLLLSMGLAAFPLTGAAAAGPTTPPNNTRLETRWARQQATYQRQDKWLTVASTVIARVQTMIDKANAKGWDTSAVQAALNALSAVIPAVQAAHAPGAAIITSHAGFDANGLVTDRGTAIATAKSLAQVLKNTRTAMNGTLKAVHAAVKAFREAHPRRTTTPAAASPTY